MSIATEKKIIIDYKQPREVKVITFLQYDTNIIKIIVEDNGEVADLSNITRIVVNFLRPDQKVISQELTATNNEIIYRLTDSEMLKAGDCYAALQLFGGDERLTVAKFKVVISESIESGEAPTAEEIRTVTQLVDNVNEKLQELSNLEKGAQGAKGDPFTYADFTPSQIESLRGPRGLPSDMIVSKQKANYETVFLNSRVINGLIVPNNNGFTTFDYMEIEEGTTNIIIARNYNAGGVNFNLIAYYDAEKNYISGFNTGATATDLYGRLNLMPPSNAKYLRFSVQGVYQRIGIFLNTYSHNFNHYNYYDSNKSKWFGKKVVAYGDSLVAGASNSIETWLGIAARELGYEPCNRGIGGSTVLQSDTTRTAYIADGVTDLSIGEYGELVNRPVEHGGTASSKPPGTVEIKSSMCTDERVNTIPVDADAIIILAGANGMDEASYRLMLQKIYTRCPEAIVFCCSHTFRYSDDTKTQIFDSTSLNTVIKNLCQELGSHYIDLKGLEGINQYNQSIYLSDRIHANLRGNQRRAMAISSVLRTIEPLS